MGKRGFFYTLFIALSTWLYGAKVPASKGFVNDFANVLSAGEIQLLEAKLRRYSDSTTTQIAVVIEAGLNGNTPPDRAMEFAEEWKIGSKENNNGVILYLAISDQREDRGYYTLTSQATQGKLTDGIVGQIQRDSLVPYLKQNAYYTAIDKTLSGYIQALQGEFKAGSGKKEKVPGWIVLLIIFGIIFFIGVINNSRYNRGYRRGGAYWFPGSWGGGWGSGGGWGGGSGGGGGWGGFGGGGGFDGGGAGGNW